MVTATTATSWVRLGFVPIVFFTSLLRSAIEFEATPVSFFHPPGILKDSDLARDLAFIEADVLRAARSIPAIRT